MEKIGEKEQQSLNFEAIDIDEKKLIKKFREEFFNCFSFLSKKEIFVLKLRLLNELSYDEIAAKLNVSREGVRQILIKAIEKIKDTLTFKLELKRLGEKYEELTVDAEKEILTIKIRDICFSRRISNVFLSARIDTIGDLVKKAGEDLLQLCRGSTLFPTPGPDLFPTFSTLIF